jgi:hypothetical protein
METFSRVAPLGVRFWDIVSRRIVDTGLTVIAYPQGQATQRTSLFPNRSGVYVLHHASGFRDFEHGGGDAAFWRNAPSPRPFIVEVSDQETRFQPFSFTVDVPRRGLLTATETTSSSPPSSPPLGIPLYSSVARAVPAGMAVVRAELWDAMADKPAAWALLEVRITGQEPARGLADDKGRIVVMFPYPEPVPGTFGSPLGSPPGGGQRSVFAQAWPLQLQAFYSPQAVVPVLPQLERVHAQAPATLLSATSPLLPLPSVPSLRFGQELIVKSEPQSILLLLPAGSPL